MTIGTMVLTDFQDLGRSGEKNIWFQVDTDLKTESHISVRSR